MASVWNGTPCSRLRAASSATGWTVPTSLFAHMTLTRAVSAACSSSTSRRPSTDSRPQRSGSSHETPAPRASTRYSTGSRTAWCSMALVTIRVRAGSASRRASQVPLTARLSASVPPEVKTTSDGRQPSAAATRSRDSSTVLRAARPAVCSEEALPTRPADSTKASTAAGSIGVVAAWSR